MTSDVHAVIAAAKRPERTHQLCTRGDLVAEIEQLNRELEAAPVVDSLAGDGRRALAEQITALQEQMRGSMINFVLRAVPPRRWRQLLVEHPAREDAARDKVWGINEETFFVALVRECTVTPVLSDEDWETLLDGISDGQWDRLASTAWNLNQGAVDVPFSLTASQILENSASE